jgi:hypothetical protein
LAEALLIETWTRILFGQDAFQLRVIALNHSHRFIDERTDRWLRRICLQARPPGLFGNPEDV